MHSKLTECWYLLILTDVQPISDINNQWGFNLHSESVSTWWSLKFQWTTSLGLKRVQRASVTNQTSPPGLLQLLRKWTDMNWLRFWNKKHPISHRSPPWSTLGARTCSSWAPKKWRKWRTNQGKCRSMELIQFLAANCHLHQYVCYVCTSYVSFSAPIIDSHIRPQ